MNSSVKYVGARLLRVLYIMMHTEMLHDQRTNLTLLNIFSDGVMKSAFSIIRAALFCSLTSLLIFVAVVRPQIIQP